MPYIPTPIRAALGLAATAVAEARRLPETLPQLSVAAASTAMHASLRMQQQIATFAARGDEVISQLRGTSAEPPSWATFDDTPAADLSAPAKAAFDRVPAAGEYGAVPDNALPDDSDLGGGDSDDSDLGDSDFDQDAPGHAEPAHPVPAVQAAKVTGVAKAKPAPAKKAPAKQAAAKETAKPPATKAAAKKAPAKKAAAKKAAAKKAPAKQAAKAEPLTSAAGRAGRADPDAGPNPSTMAAEILHAQQAGPSGQQ